jgi:hypothetical protein
MSGDFRILRDLGFTPEIATELGHMCVAWAALEWRLFSLYHAMTDAPTAIARAAFYSHFSARDRLSLTLSTAHMVLRGSQKREAAFAALEKLAGKVRKTAAKRNSYIHNPWAMEPGKPETLSQFQLGGDDIHGRGKRVSQKDLSQLTDQIVSWTELVRGLEERILPLLPASLGKLDRTRAATLVFAPSRGRGR